MKIFFLNRQQQLSFCTFLTRYLPMEVSIDSQWRVFTLKVDKKGYFWTTCPHHSSYRNLCIQIICLFCYIWIHFYPVIFIFALILLFVWCYRNTIINGNNAVRRKHHQEHAAALPLAIVQINKIENLCFCLIIIHQSFKCKNSTWKY